MLGRDVVSLPIILSLFGSGCTDQADSPSDPALSFSQRSASVLEGSFVGDGETPLRFTAAAGDAGDVTATFEVDGFVAWYEGHLEGGGSLDTNGAPLTEIDRAALVGLVGSLEDLLRDDGEDPTRPPDLERALLGAARRLSAPGVVDEVQRWTGGASMRRDATDEGHDDEVITPSAVCWGYYYVRDGQCRASSTLYWDAVAFCGGGNWPSTIFWDNHCGGGPDPYYHWYVFTCCHD